MQQLSVQGAMFLHAEMETVPQHIGEVTIYNQGTAPNGILRFKQVFRHKLAIVPLGLRQSQTGDDPDSINRHILPRTATNSMK